jgi:hypothetical protein
MTRALDSRLKIGAAVTLLGMVLAVLVFFYAIPAFQDRRAETPLDAATLIDRFHKVAFRGDSTPEDQPDQFRSVLYRWEGPLRLTYQGVPTEVRQHAEQFYAEIQNLSGLRVWEVPENSVTPPNMIVHRPEQSEYNALFASVVTAAFPNKDDPNKGFCFFYYQVYDPQRAVKIDIKLNPSFENRDYRFCILEEIIQSLGLIGDTIERFDSLFVEHGSWRKDFPLNDKILLRTLYDPRLRDGMARAQAMARVERIIPELLAAYKREGIEGLHQPLSDARW